MTSPVQPLVSVALCVYNGERYLREQLDSILAQEGVRIEVVAVDDFSTDGSVALLHEYAARDPRIRVFANDSNLGHLCSFDRAMSLCAGAFIAPSDHDDIWHPAKLCRLLGAIGGSDLAYCDSEYIGCEGQLLGGRISDDLTMHAGRDPLRFVFQNTVSGHALLVRREVIASARPFPTLLYHDWWLAIRAAAGNGVVYVDAPLVRFRRHVAAYSSLGKKRELQGREGRSARPDAGSRPSRNRKWFEELLYITDAFAATGWRGHDAAGDWHAALREAGAGRSGMLFKLIWRDRASVPPWRGLAWINALRCYLRCIRKIRCAMREPMPTTPLFRG